MPRKKRCNHGATCTPVTGKCRKSRANPGSPVVVSRPCRGCGEERCFDHCGCGRTGVPRTAAKAKAQPRRTANTTATTVRSQQPQQPPQPVVLPVREAQPPRLPLQVLRGAAFWLNALQEVAAARKSVFVTSLVYDNAELQKKLLKALERQVKVTVLVDRVSLGDKPRSQERLKALKKKGAKVQKRFKEGSALGSGRIIRHTKLFKFVVSDNSTPTMG